ncbi:2325_t:CDS:2, partial [Dentiscutata heterogama]
NGTQEFIQIPDKSIFFSGLKNELAKMIPVEEGRLSSTERRQIDLSITDSQRLLISLSINEAKSSDKRITTQIRNDLDMLIRNKEFTSISTGSYTQFLDDSYGFIQTSSALSTFSFIASKIYGIKFDAINNRMKRKKEEAQMREEEKAKEREEKKALKTDEEEIDKNKDEEEIDKSKDEEEIDKNKDKEEIDKKNEGEIDKRNEEIDKNKVK